jgi:hypothetical protein
MNHLQVLSIDRVPKTDPGGSTLMTLELRAADKTGVRIGHLALENI